MFSSRPRRRKALKLVGVQVGSAAVGRWSNGWKDGGLQQVVVAKLQHLSLQHQCGENVELKEINKEIQ